MCFFRQVKEVRKTDKKDVDFIGPEETVFAVWAGKFKQAQTSVSRYRIYISSEPKGKIETNYKCESACHFTRNRYTWLIFRHYRQDINFMLLPVCFTAYRASSVNRSTLKHF